ncbi:GNAT family N-acetyltransferase [Pseudomonas sp. CFBP 8758]|uniref:GNAT family N-acetyltransferase n=1 Tax=unclassified Pseudomonas TaxID=196821 RepID=UPI0017805ACC|nr:MULTISPECIES: GNAT family N-acetyltransferase [unclassified Pseudomonas]MBD8594173.1 GNAT family N-acetyltransferase [Pseudomonas sp. CFBP 8758]MBD8604204.1 GNAT family N-acetyltransferase [Pseudomonas sp. CFBP 8771]
MAIEWMCMHHSELDVHQLYEILRLRSEVFVVEQQCPYQDVDGQDLYADTCHLLAWSEGRLVAYLRLLDPSTQSGDVVIGRVITAPSARGTGLGHALLANALEHAARRWPQMPIKLSAQAHLQGYYGRYGFIAHGQEYLEDNIAHIAMYRRVEAQG